MPRRTHSLAALIVLCLFAATPVFPQRYSFKYYGQEDGLSNLVPKSILQDRTGFLWVGTQNGLFRYDGRRFAAFGRADGLPSTLIYSLHETADGKLWVGTRSGLAVRVGDRFELVHPGVVSRSSFASTPDGALFVRTDEGLLAGWPDATQPGGMKFLFHDQLPGGEKIAGMHIDPAGRMWFGCGLALCRVEAHDIASFFKPQGTASILPSVWGPDRGVPPARWDSIKTDAGGNLWIRSERRLMMLEQKGSRFVAMDHGLPHSTNTAPLYVDRDHRLWVPTDEGLARRVDGKWHIVGRRQGLPVNSDVCVLQDREGSLWIGLGGGGLARWLGYNQWESWTEAEGLTNPEVWAIARDASGTLWAGTESGLNVLAGDPPRWKSWTESSGLASNRVRAVVPDRDGSLWIGGSPGGVARITPRTGAVEMYGVAAGITSDRITALLVDSERSLWVTTWSGLFRSAAGGARRFEKVQIPGVTNDHFSNLLLDRAGRVWVAGAQGLAVWDGKAWKRYTTEHGLKSGNVQRLAQAPDGSLWIGYLEGLGISRLTFPGERLRVENFTREDGPRSDKPIFLATDARGWVWLGTDDGLDVYNGRAWRHFGKADGLIWDDCSANAVLADSDGSFWIGTSRGLSHFRPPADLFRPNEGKGPPSVITTARFGDNRPLGVEAAGTSSHRIGYRDRTFQVFFSGLTYLDEGGARFRYRLHGLEESWTETDHRDARYSSLPAGDYTFEVLARNAAGMWGDTPARVAFTVLAPWWQTWWFRALCLLLVVGAARLLWTARLRRLLVVQRRLEEAVEVRTHQLVSEKNRVEVQNQEIERLLREAQQSTRLKSQFLANMSHEIRTPLNGIMGMTELALDTELPEKQREYLRLARSSADSLLAIVNDILDFSKIEAGKLDLESSAFRVREHLEDAVRPMLVRAREKHLTLEWRVALDVPDTVAGDPGRLRQILVNLVGNAIKFTDRGGVSIHVESANQDDGIRLQYAIRDTGIGIPTDKQSLIFESFRQADESITRKFGGTGLGLAISSQLAEMMGGRLWLESEAGAGSAFFFTARFERQSAALAAPVATKPVNGGVPPRVPPLRILIAEDNVINQKLMVSLLEKQGHTIALATDGREALAELERQPFDVVLMDVQMPEMGGFEATAVIREREKGSGTRTTVIAMTANAMKGYRERCLEAGMDDYLSKPVLATELYQKIGAIRPGQRPRVHSAGG